MRGEIDNRTFFAGAETQVLPSEKRFLLGRVAIIDRVACLDCGDCDSACSFGAIEQGKNNADEAFAGHRIIYEKCIGCGGCLSCCEMRAIRLADGAKGALDAEITARHDENPLPELGKPVDVFNAFGEKISGGRVTQALAGSNAGRAATIRFRLPREFLNRRMQMIIVGICGGSGSGKSTFAERIRDGLNCSCEIMRLDCYYFDQGGKPFEERTKVNYDSPKIFDFDEMLADIRLLLDGKPVTRKGYNYAEHRRDDSEELMYPPEVLIIEGIHVFYDDRICDIMNLKLFIKVDSDICLLRRIARDMNERGRSLESISEQYKATVKPMREKYIDRYIDKADVVVMRGGMNEQALKTTISYIKSCVKEQRLAESEKNESDGNDSE